MKEEKKMTIREYCLKNNLSPTVKVRLATAVSARAAKFGLEREKDAGGNYAYAESALDEIRNGLRNDTPSKQRFFRKGDRVKLRKELDGRDLTCLFQESDFERVFTVKSDENKCFVTLENGDSLLSCFFAELELVAPMESLRVYYVVEEPLSWQIRRSDYLVTRYLKAKNPLAQQCALRDCEELNKAYSEGKIGD